MSASKPTQESTQRAQPILILERDHDSTGSVIPVKDDLSNVRVVLFDFVHSRNWVGSLKQCASELALTPTDKHALFTLRNVVNALTELIKNKSFKISREPDSVDTPITVTFTLTMLGDVLGEIHDKLMITLNPVTPPHSTVAISDDKCAALSKRVEEQNAEIARLSRLISESHVFARDFEINRRISHIAAIYGFPNERLYITAQHVIAAEVDGKPIIFRKLGYRDPVWIQSVIRYVNVCDPLSYIIARKIYMGRQSDRSTNFDKLIHLILRHSKCKLLVIMPHSTCEHNHHSSIPDNRSKFWRYPATPIIIFGHTLDTKGQTRYESEVNWRLRNVSFHPGNAVDVRIAKLSDEHKEETRCISKYNSDIERAYAEAIPALYTGQTYYGFNGPDSIMSMSANFVGL